MLSAHVSYWQSNSFATFVLLQLFTDFGNGKEAPTIVPKLDPAIVTGSIDLKGKRNNNGDNNDDNGNKGNSLSDEDEDKDKDDDDDDEKEGKSKGVLLSAIPLPGIM